MSTCIPAELSYAYVTIGYHPYFTALVGVNIKTPCVIVRGENLNHAGQE